jgi:hypothetical protein
MRKGLLALVLSLLLVVFSAGSVFAGIVVKVGPDISGKIEASLSGVSASTDVKMGITVGGEYLFDSDSDLVYGAGFEYQLARQVDIEDGIKFNYTPIYALARYQLDSFYLTAKAGYNLFQLENLPEDETLSGGLFYGIGGGMDFGQFQVELLYSINNGARKMVVPPETFSLNYKYSKISLSVGYKL